MGFRLFLHSVELVFRQLSDALRVSGALYVMSLVLSVIGFVFFMQRPVASQAPTFSWQIIPIILATTVIYLWIAVAWHRFVLLDEQSNTSLPELHGDRLLAYFGRFLQAGLICVIAGVVLGIGYGIVVTIAQGALVVALAGLIVMTAVLLLIGYRLAPIFPGAAIGRPVDIGVAWAATGGASGAIMTLAIVSSIASVLIDLPAELLKHLPAGPILVFIWTSITAWVKLMVGISILTTLYGVYVEKRPIG